MALNPSSLLYTRLSSVKIIRILDIKIAAPDARLRCDASPKYGPLYNGRYPSRQAYLK